MSGRDYTTTELLRKIKRFAFLPDANGQFTDSELLSMATEVQDEVVVPAIEATRENYYVDTQDVSPVANQQEYLLPEHATGAVLRSVTWLDPSGFGIKMAWYPLNMRDEFVTTNYTPSVAPGFTFQGDKVALLPAPLSGSGTLRFRFYNRPGKLVTEAEAMLITGTTPASGRMLGNPPAAWTTSDYIDVVSGDRTFEHIIRDALLTTVTASTLVEIDPAEFDAQIRPSGTDLRARDWVALAGETPIPQVPPKLHPALARLTASAALQDLDDDQWQGVEAVGQARLKRGISSLAPRNHGESQRVVNRRSAMRLRHAHRHGGWKYR